MEFTLNKKQEKELNIWKEKIKDLFGEYGLYTFKFTPNGIGTSIKIYSHLTKTELDLSFEEDW
jgi:hypothetical protein